MPPNDTIIAAFTDMAPSYDQSVDRELRQFWGVGYREFIGSFLARLRLAGDEHILDIGTGLGVIPGTLVLRPDWRGRVVGLDITPAMLAGARKMLAGARALGRVDLVCGSGATLPLAENAFDVVTCALATHHIDVPSLLREVHRVLRPGGKLLLADVGLTEFWGTYAGRLSIGIIAAVYTVKEGKSRVRAELDAMKNMFTPEAWRSLFGEAGFAGVNMQVLRAKRPWYPPGLLMYAESEPVSGSLEGMRL